MATMSLLKPNPSGLAAAHHALQLYPGEEEVEIVLFEKAGQVGGLWNNRPSPIYPHLHTNSPAPIMELEVGGQQLETEESSFLHCQVLTATNTNIE